MSDNDNVSTKKQDINDDNQHVPELRFPGFTNEWKKVKLGDIFEFYPTNSFSRAKLNYNGGNIRNIHYGDIHTKFPTIMNINKNTIPFINSNVNASKIKDESYCKNGDIIIADASENYDDIGKTIEIMGINKNYKVVAGLHTLLARDNNKVMADKFRGYLFQINSLKLQMKKLANGISVLGISKSNIKKMEVYIPSKPEQTKIANIIYLVDKKIEYLEKKKEIKLKIKEYYIQQIFLEDWDNKIKFYDYKPLNEITFYQEGPGVRNYQYTNKGVKLLNVGNFVKNKLILENTDRYISKEEAYGKYKHFLVDEGDLLIACSGIKAEYFNEKIAFAEKKDLPLCMNTSTMRFKSLDDNYLNLNYLKWYFQTPLFKKEIFRILTGSAQFNFGPTHLKYLKILIPPLDYQIKIGNFMDLIKENIDYIDIKIKLMKQFKKGLLQKMFV